MYDTNNTVTKLVLFGVYFGHHINTDKVNAMNVM